MAVKVKHHKDAWWVFIDHKGKRKAKRIGTSKRAAEDVAGKIQARIALGQFEITDEQQRRPFDEYFQRWLTTYVKSHCKESTFDRYQRSYRLFLLPAFGHKSMPEISREEVKRLVYDMLAQGKSHNTVKAVLTPLIEMFHHAVEDGHVTVNPALRVLRRSRAEEGKTKAKAQCLTREEVGVLLRTCQEHYPASYPFVSLLLKTGLRFHEATCLQWEDIDFHGDFLNVKHTFYKGRLTLVKGNRARQVDMSVKLSDTLKTLLVERKKETLRKGWGDVPPWVFTSETGTPLNHGHFSYRLWRPLLNKAGLRHVRIHDCRHTFASLLIQHGESLAYVKEQMGHHSIQVTVDTYGHLIPGGNKAAVNRLDGLEEATIRNPTATNASNTVSEDVASARTEKKSA